MMKKLLTILLFSLFGSGVFAQNFAGTDYGFRLGLTAHPNFGWYKPENGKSNGVNVGFAYGLMADFNFAENYSIATGITLTTINGRTTEVGRNIGFPDGPQNRLFDLKYMMQYVEIPLTVKLKTDKLGESRWYGQFGLSNDFKTKSRMDTRPDPVDKREINQGTKFYRAGLIIGGGLEYDIASHTSVVVGLTFNNGFTNITSDSNRSIKNHYFGLNLGMFF
ncbi:porin family protein [Pedobacter antarcticus]|jgi:hypothetical protein|uniref:porin family protein n=1 Tax=Pedobacter antarcticus TaxID=34086 RepID=UPI001C57B31F|nr:outer membrane beta-barrel protein [Pedobacter antarcticus]